MGAVVFLLAVLEHLTGAEDHGGEKGELQDAQLIQVFHMVVEIVRQGQRIKILIATRIEGLQHFTA